MQVLSQPRFGLDWMQDLQHAVYPGFGLKEGKEDQGLLFATYSQDVTKLTQRVNLFVSTFLLTYSCCARIPISVPSTKHMQVAEAKRVTAGYREFNPTMKMALATN